MADHMRRQPKNDPPWKLQFGARPLGRGQVEFRVWAPLASRLEVELLDGGGRVVPLVANVDDVFSARTRCAVGADYWYCIDGICRRPDPVSRWQPHGVHGPSRVVDPAAHCWRDDDWRGRLLDPFVIYELHVGTFNAPGSFDAVVERLPHLVRLGVTAIELMPVAAFAGERNWGYDGVHLYAPQQSYGGPTGLKRLVDACHACGLAVVLDVVYNHLGPLGNYLHDFGPYFTRRQRTPWGEAINYDGPDSAGVRRHVVDNARYWLDEYHIDALRLDAIHGISDDSPRHILSEIATAARAQSRASGRRHWIIAESDLNDSRVIRPLARGGLGLDGQWSDDFHRALHAAVTRDQRGYFVDFGRIDQLATAIGNGFVYQGQRSRYRRRPHGSSSADRPGKQFVVYQQNHDQVANACQGIRIGQFASPAAQRLGAALIVSAPNLPLLFMGEEYGETRPFCYFVDHGDDRLNRAVARGRRREYAAFGGAARFRSPHLASTFAACRLDWAKLDRHRHRDQLRYYRDLLALRRHCRALGNCRKDLTRVSRDERGRWLCVERRDPRGAAALVVANLGPRSQKIHFKTLAGCWRRRIWSEQLEYGGDGRREPPLQLDGARCVLELGPRQVAIYVRERR